MKEIKQYYSGQPQSEISQTAQDNSEVDPSLLQSTVANLDRYIGRHRADLDKRTLYERQLTVFESMRDFIKDGETEGYVKLPAGVGKTVLFIEFIEATRLKTLIVVPTTILVNQTERRLRQFAEGLDVGKIYSAAKQFGKEVIITTYKSFVQNVNNGKLSPKDYELLVLDEFHEARSQIRTETAKKFTNSIKLGFSATPPVNTLFKEIHSMSIKEAVEEDLLCSFSVFIAQSDVDLTQVSFTSRGEYQEEELQKAIDVYNRNQGAVDIYKKMFDGQTAVTYCVGIKHAGKMAELFREAGISAGVISGNNTDKEKEKLLEQFKNGEIKVLCNADILIRGFDEPRASVCLNLRPTLSAELAEQRGGRVLRKDPNNSQKYAYIVDFFDKTDNPRNLPIGFAQIAEGSQILTPRDIDRRQGVAGNGERSRSMDEREIYIAGLKLIVDAKEVFRIIREIEGNKYQPSPEGWKNMNSLRLKLNLSSSHGLGSKVNVERELHADWFNYYLDSGGRVQEYFAPELVEKISEYFLKLQLPAEGWLNMNNLRTALNKGDRPIKRLMNPYRNSHPEWFKQYVTDRGVVREFYSPKLVSMVRTEMSRFQPAPSGWDTYDNLRKAIKRGAANVKKTAYHYRKEHPEWFQKSLSKTGKITEFYSPELIAQIKKDLGVASEENH